VARLGLARTLPNKLFENAQDKAYPILLGIATNRVGSVILSSVVTAMQEK
jgi:hypothetical protein